MQTHADKNHATPASADLKRQRGDESTALFANNRAEAITLRQLQETANDSPQTRQLQAAQDMANASPLGHLTLFPGSRPKSFGGLSGKTAQLKSGPEEEELLQGRFQTLQRQGSEVEGANQEPEAEREAIAESGTVPDGELPEDPAYTKGPDDRAQTNRRDADGESARSRGVPVRVSLGGVSASNSRQSSPTGARLDAVTSTATVSWSNPGGKGVDAFGEESFSPSYSGVKWTQEAKDKPINITFKLKAACSWGVNGGGNKDVASGTAGVVKADNYQDIVSDLTPALNEKSWRAPRTTYWSKAICERHEKYHSTDDKAWIEGPGKSHMESYLNNHSIDLSDKERKSSGKVTKKVKALLDDALIDLGNANFDFYTGGAGSYYSYAGEERAFGDGKQPYLDLVDAVRKQGEALAAKEEEKRKAKEAKKTKKDVAASVNPPSDSTTAGNEPART